jgi:GMP synthase (glutamine-hydrolysing)
VRAHSVREIGWYPLHLTPSAGRDRLLGSFVSGRPVFQWHAYTFDLPRHAMLLASTETCANQAFRYGERTYGLQFHLEADEVLIRRWIEREKMEAAVAERMLDDTQRHVGATRMLAERVFSEFVGLFDWRPRKIFLGAS